MTKKTAFQNLKASFCGLEPSDEHKGKNCGVFWYFFETGFLLLILYLPFQIAMNLGADIDLASGRILILGFFLIWLLASLVSKRKLSLFSFQGVGLIIFSIINGISLLIAQELEWSLRKLLFLLSIFPLYFVAVSFVRRPGGIKKIVKVLIAASMIVSLLGMVQFFSQFLFGSGTIAQFYSQKLGPLFWGQSFSSVVSENPSWFVNVVGQTLMRAFGVFPDPHMMAFFLGLILPIVFSLFLFKKTKCQTKLIIVCVLLLAVLTLTFSRGGYFGILAALGAVLILAWRFLKERKKFLMLASLVLVFVFLSVFAQPVLGRFVASFSLTEGSSLGRLEIWQDSWQVFLEHPLLGVGLGNYSREISPLAGYRNPITSHNLYLDILAETGVFGLAAWLFLVFGSLYQLQEVIKRKEEKDGLLPIRIGLFGSLSYFAVHSLFETAVFNPVILAFLMIVLALINFSLHHERAN